MKQYILQGAGDLANGLVFKEMPVPEPQPGEVLLRMQAVSLNYRDIMIAGGKYRGVDYPLVPLSDGSGVVEAVGEGVTRVRPGDRVCAIFMQTWLNGAYRNEYAPSSLGGQCDGMLREYVCLREDGVLPFPEHLSFEEAATLPCAAVTAWNALFESAALRPGSKVLVQGTGGVSIFALQFAIAAGCEVIITSGSDEKLARAKELGAAELINYRQNPEWQQELLRLAPEGVDHVVEVGGAGTFERSLRCGSAGSTISVIGVLSGVATEVNIIEFISKSLSVNGIYVGSREMFEHMNRFISTVRLKPVIDKVFSVDQIRDAYQYQIEGKHFGKVVARFAA